MVVLQIAKKLARTLDRERGIRAVLTRTGDYYLPLRKRIELARRHKADLFISIHADAFTNPRVHGSSVYVLSSRGASSEHARWLAERENASDLIGGVSLDDKDSLLASVLLDLSQTASLEASIDAAERVLEGLKKVGKLHKPGVESAAFAVLKSPDIPSLLVETAFISNPNEEKKLRDSAYQQKLAQAMTASVRRYFVANAPNGTFLATRQPAIEPRRYIERNSPALPGQSVWVAGTERFLRRQYGNGAGINPSRKQSTAADEHVCCDALYSRRYRIHAEKRAEYGVAAGNHLSIRVQPCLCMPLVPFPVNNN